ncbi:TonB-dependent receptor [Edaphobacter sp.]|uniref:TonB-dependent receptor n=1 Tax=Edaphobacter sp. TaxID=1934404 RepID=UPI002DBE0A46|nr:carboxypeptidase regulatory-like domain-containing protein [Edaphobacter sp.]HEU5339683.1 carboxypeptidase regulatory-like domain-containing protein [Edaphobacter sp.]
MRSKHVLRMLVCCLALFLTRSVLAQATTSLSGTVTDTSGAVVPGAAVKLVSPLTGVTRATTTDKGGAYAFPQLAPGRYELTVVSAGFATAKRPAFDLLVSQPATINMTLSVATSVSEVTVSAGGQPMLNTTDATLGNTFEGKQIQDLPIEGRNVPDLLSLQPGVTFLGRTDSNTGNTSVGNTSGDSRSGATNGGRSDQSNITLDGVDVNDVNNGYAFTSVLRVTQDSVSEFRVTTTNPNAEEGRSSGAQVALVTRSGTNSIHGAVYAYNRNNLFHANDFFNKQTQAAEKLPNTPLKLIRNVFGADIGGPIKKDRAFYFLNYEGRRDTQGFVSNGNTVPRDSLRQGFITYTCANASACPGGTYTLTPDQIKSMDPQNIGANAAVEALFAKYPEPNNPTVGDGLNTEGYSFAYNAKRSYNTYIARLDWDIDRAGKHTVFWRGNLQNDREPGGPQFPGQPASSTTLTNSKGFGAGYTYLISSSLVNAVIFGLTRQGVSSSGLVSAPYVTLQGTTPLTSNSSSHSAMTPVYNLADNLTWTKGGHNIAFGTNIRFISNRSSSNSLSYSNATGTYQYLNPAAIAGGGGPFDPGAFGFPDVANKFKGPYNSALMGLVGIINVGNITYNNTKDGKVLPVGTPVVRNYRWNEYEFYGQDTWKATRNLSLTYGLRYSYLQTPAETSGNQVGVCVLTGDACASGNFSLSNWVNQRGSLAAQGKAAIGAGELGFPLSGRYNGKPDYWQPSKVDFAPRFAVAYSPSVTTGFWGRLLGNNLSSIRAGYSLVFDHFGAGITNSFDTEGSFGLATTLQTSAGVLKIGNAPRFTSVNAVPQSLLPAAPAVGFPGIPVRSGPTSGAIYWSEDSGVKTPYAHLIDLSFTRQIGNGSSFEVSYVGHLAHHLFEQEDVAMPTNLSAAGTTYFAAARQMALLSRANGGNGVDVSTVAPIAYWQQLFSALDGQDIGFGPGLTATQNIYLLYQENIYNEANALYALDMPDAATDAGINPDGAYPSNRFYHDQFSALYAWRSVGASNYNALQAVYRQKVGLGLQFDLNYTYSKSLDTTSQAERLGSSGGINNAQIFNTWDPNQIYGASDFDIRHQINSNYIWTLPFGRGQRFVSSIGRVADLVIGGWETTGIVRWTSGLPFAVDNGGNYPTNYDIQGFATQIGKIPSGHGKLQQRFADPVEANAAFDFTLPGDSGTRNPLRGDGYFSVDAGLHKTFALTERYKLKAGIEVFNVSNSVRFDAHSIAANVDNAHTFGNARSELTNPRLAQFFARFEF